MQFIVKKIEEKNLESELNKIGFDSSYIEKGSVKHKFLNIKIFNLIPQQASIIKQAALSLGCDCAVNRGVLDCSTPKSDAILSGSFSQLQNVAEKLKFQPFSLSKLSDLILEELKIQNKINIEPKIMGILNLSEDSFSTYSKNPIGDALLMIKQGAKIIDIGAESTRPGANEIKPEIQIEKIIPILKELKKHNIEVSIDTRSSLVAEECLKCGADIINDVSFANFDSKIVDCSAKYSAKYILTHSRGIPSNMNDFANYENVVDEIFLEIQDKIDFVLEKGIKKENLIIDVGFGFAKNVEQNIEIIKRIEEFRSFGFEILCGTSRKRVIQALSNKKNDADYDFITALTSFYFTLKNVDYIRVHNVSMTKTAIDFAKRLK